MATKYLKTIILVFVSALIIPVMAFGQTQPDPIKQDENSVLPVFNESLQNINEGTVDTKNATLAANKSVTEALAVATSIPAISAPAQTAANGSIVMTFTNGTLLPSELSSLWAKVTYNGKTEYWKLHPAMISSDGKSFSMQFGPEYANVSFQWQLYGFDTEGNKTNFSNTVGFRVVNPGTVAMPSASAPSSTTAAGQITITLATPVLPAQLSGLWARVSYDNKTEYWKLDPGMLSSDGKNFYYEIRPFV